MEGNYRDVSAAAIEAKTGRGKKVTEVEGMLGDVSGEQKHTGLPCGLFLVVDAESAHGEHVSQKKKKKIPCGEAEVQSTLVRTVYIPATSYLVRI